MKKVVLILILSISAVLAIPQGRLLNFSFATYAIDHFQNGWPGDLRTSIYIADGLRVAVFAGVNMMNSSIGGTQTNLSLHAYEDSDVTANSFVNSAAKNYNFIFYQGHGLPNKITLWNQNGWLRNTDAGNGVRNTYWVWLSACTVFRNGFSDQDPWFNGVFKGAHSILGLSSLGFGNSYVRTAYQNFALRWIAGNQKIWEAYYISIMETLHNEGGYDIEPKIVYRYGYIDGRFFDPWEERFTQAYKGPVFYNNDYEGIGSRWVTLGAPIYERPR